MRVEIGHYGRKAKRCIPADALEQPLIRLVYQNILNSLQADLAEWLSVPNVIPVSFHINYYYEFYSTPKLEFFLGNGGFVSKMENFYRNRYTVLHYAFRITDNEKEVASGLFKVKVMSEDRSQMQLSAAQ